MASRILVVCIFRVTQLCNFTVYFTVKYVNSLVHAHYYPYNRYQAFIFRASVRPFVSLRTRKSRPGDEATFHSAKIEVSITNNKMISIFVR